MYDMKYKLLQIKGLNKMTLHGKLTRLESGENEIKAFSSGLQKVRKTHQNY